MEKEILNKVLELLEKYGNDQLLYLTVLFIGVTLVNLVTVVYTSRLIERHKNNLKKKEVKFSVYNQIQIKKMSELFDLSHELKCNTSAYVNIFKNNIDPPQLTESKTFIKSYEALTECYSKNRYIFPKDIKSHFNTSAKSISEFRFNVSILAEKTRLVRISTEDFDKEIEQATNEIGDYHFKDGSLTVMLFCEELKVLIETHFEEWD